MSEVKSKETRWQRALAFFTAPVDALPLRVFEAAFTVAFLIDTGWHFYFWREWLTDWGFHLSADDMWALGFLRPFPAPPLWGIPLFAGMTLLAGLGVIFCRWRRFSLLLMLAVAIYVQGVDPMSTQALNKIAIAIYALLVTAPGYWRDGNGRLMVSAAPLRIMQATLIAHYWAAGYSKAVGGDWLRYSDCLWCIVQGFHRTEEAAFLLRVLPVWAWAVMQYVTLLFELGAPAWFSIPRLRWFVVVYGVGFHIMIALLMKRVCFFSFIMISFYALFVTAAGWRWLRAYVRLFTSPPIPGKALPRSIP